MNLYKILFTHTAPKDREEGIKEYLLAESEEQVFEYVDEKYNYGGWKDKIEDDGDETYDIYDDNYEVIGKETFKEKMIRIKGQMNDEDYDYSDAYYGITLHGWELIEEDTKTDYTKMIHLGIVFRAVGEK